jgi:hypothetical protein
MSTTTFTPGWYLPNKDKTTNEIRLVSTNPTVPTSPHAVWCDEQWLEIFEKSGVTIKTDSK